MRTVVFTGAGAGKADGIPTQTELFRTFFRDSAAQPGPRQELARAVADFFAVSFSVDPIADVNTPLPTFEEALGIIDLALARDEGLFRVGQVGNLGADLRMLRRQLVLALAATVARDRRRVPEHHGKLVRALREADAISGVTFVTTNYDTMIDDAVDAEAVGTDRGTGSLVDYGFADLSSSPAEPHGDDRSFPCLKIHGSVNWLYCPVCDVLDVTHASDGVTRLVDEPDAARCLICETFRTPVIVPPSYYKNMSNVHLGVVWNKASRALQGADNVVFVGYSFPTADFHVKYLLKRAQMNRNPSTQALRVLLVNHHQGRNAVEARAETARFARFLGVSNVVDLQTSFEQFANDPVALLRR